MASTWSVSAVTDTSVSLINPDGSRTDFNYDLSTGAHANPIVDHAIGLIRAGSSPSGTVVITIGGV